MTVPATLPAPAAHLSLDDIEAFGAEMDAIRAAVLADLGAKDVDHIRRVIGVQRGMEVAGRCLLWVGWFPPAWLAGVAALSTSKILDNMEVGHNVMHGQYDWTGDPALRSSSFEWDTACPADQWRHSHNYLHHTFTNIRGKDRDLGYGVLRMTEEERWTPRALGNPVYAFLLATFFQYGVMMHDLEVENIAKGKRTWAETKPLVEGMAKKAGRQTLKDYVLFPLLSGPGFLATLTGNAVANLARNYWSFMIIFCGHFPDGVSTFEPGEEHEPSRGRWYVRQLLGSANIRGGNLFHVLSGNLSHQIEHHLFPDLPAHRYAAIGDQVRAACERYGLPYNSAGLAQQFGSVVRRICRMALPNRSAPTPAEAALPVLEAAVRA